MNRLLTPSLAFALCLAAACAAASCRDAKDGEVATIGKDYATTNAGVYAFTPFFSGESAPIVFGTSAKPDVFRFCAYLELPPTGANSVAGVYFWSSHDSEYRFSVLENGDYQITHIVFDESYYLAPARPIPDLGHGPPRMREIDIEANPGGASVKLDGRTLTDFVARPLGGETAYGLAFKFFDKKVAFRFAAPILFGK